MFDFYERRKIKQWLYSWPALTVLVIVSVFLIHGVWGVYKQERITRINKNQRLTHLEELEVRREALQEEIDRLNTERGIEEEIRQKFEVGREGEEVILIVDPPTNGSESEDKASTGIFYTLIEAIIFWK